MELMRHNKAYVVEKSDPPSYSQANLILGVTSLPETDCDIEQTSEE